MLVPLTGLPAPQQPGDAGSPPLSPGQHFRAVVQGRPGALAVRMAGQHIPLPPDTAAFQPGQAVSVEVVARDAGIALRIVPEQAPAATAQGVPTDPQRILAAVLGELGRLPAAADAADVVPARVQHMEAALRQVLRLFLERGALGDDVQRLAALVGQAANAGTAADASALFLALAQTFAQADAATLEDMLGRLARARSTEARLAAALAGGDTDGALAALRDDLRNEVARLRGNEALRAWLRGQNQLKAFEAAAQRVLERLDGAALQNLRGLDHPYVFLDLPLPEQTGFRRAQVHFFADGRGQRFRRDAATVALDLSTTRLGELWVALRAAPNQCTCRFLATSPETVAAIEAGAHDLADALAKAGYPNARVSAAAWDGDRLRETAALMRHYAGLDVTL